MSATWPHAEENAKPDRLLILHKRKAVMVSYLRMKADEEDWHGVQDAASDLRDIEAELKGLAR
jgi:hypothetical protein